MKTRPLIERSLLVVGLVCCAVWGYAWIDSHWFEMQQSRRLDAALAAREAARIPETAPTAAPAAASRGISDEAMETFDTFLPEEFGDLSRDPAEGDLLGRLEVERLGVSALFLQGIEETTLRRGVGHIPGTAPIVEAGEEGAIGNIGIAGHRDSFFRGLKDVGQGDVVNLQTLAGTWRYRVTWTRIVDPKDVYVLDPTDEAALTLVTCYPFHYVGTAPKRFIVRAERIADSA